MWKTLDYIEIANTYPVSKELKTMRQAFEDDQEPSNWGRDTSNMIDTANKKLIRLVPLPDSTESAMSDEMRAYFLGVHYFEKGKCPRSSSIYAKSSYIWCVERNRWTQDKDGFKRLATCHPTGTPCKMSYVDFSDNIHLVFSNASEEMQWYSLYFGSDDYVKPVPESEDEEGDGDEAYEEDPKIVAKRKREGFYGYV